MRKKKTKGQDGAEAPPSGTDAAAAPKAGKKKKVLVLVVLLALLGGGGYVALGRGGPEKAPPPEPGEVLALEPITLNLADGHFLKLGLALQFTASGGGHGGGAALDGSHALDLAIDHLSNREVTELNSAPARNKAKEELTHSIEEAYHHQVMDVYFTEFVMQ